MTLSNSTIPIAALAVALCGCLSPANTPCKDSGLVCAVGELCLLGQCVSEARVEACSGIAEDSPCTVDAQPGVCLDGVCSSGCGDGVLAFGEICEPTNLAGLDCLTEDYYTGTLGCNADCTLDTSGCVGQCGDGVVNGPEFCDGAPPVNSCNLIGGDFGVPRCPADCSQSIEGCGIIGWRIMLSEPSVAVDGVEGLELAVSAAGNIYRRDGDFFDLMAELDFAPTALAVASVDSALVVGTGGRAFSYDGASWVEQVTGTTNDLRRVWPTGTGQYWVAGAAGTVLYVDGQEWISRTTGLPASELASEQIYTGLAGRLPTDLYLASQLGSIYRWDGNTWSLLTTTPLDSFCLDLAVTDDGGLWAGLAKPPYFSWVSRFDGFEWQSDGVLAGATVTATRAGVAVGSHFGDTFFFDGSQWMSLGGPGSTPLAIALRDGEFVVASASGVHRSTGNVWRLTDVDHQQVTAYHYLADDVIWSLYDHTARKFDGSWWNAEAINPDAPEGSPRLTALWCADADVCYAGSAAVVYKRESPNTWQGMPLPDSLTPNRYFAAFLHSISGTHEDDVWLGGTIFVYGIPVRGFVIHFDGDTLERIPDGTLVADGKPPPFVEIVAVADDDVYAFGTDGRLLHYDGAEWTTEQIGIVPQAVFGRSLDEMVVAGTSGQVARRVGSEWMVEQTPTANTLLSAWANGPDDIFAAGVGGTLVYYDGTQWSLVDTPTNAPIGALAGSRRLMYLGSQSSLELERLQRWKCLQSEENLTDHVDDDCNGIVDQ